MNPKVTQATAIKPYFSYRSHAPAWECIPTIDVHNGSMPKKPANLSIRC